MRAHIGLVKSSLNWATSVTQNAIDALPKGSVQR